MKKILFLIHDLGQGGAEKVLVNLVNNMNRSRFDITVMALFGGGVNERFLEKHIHYLFYYKKSFPANTHYLKLFSPHHLYKQYIKGRYDIVISYLEGTTARVVSGCEDNKTKIICWIHAIINKNNGAIGFRSFNEAKKLYGKFDYTVCVSECVRDNFVKTFSFEHPIGVLYNTVESEKIISLSKEEIDDYFFQKDKITIISVGSIKAIKSFDRLVRIHKRLLDDGIKNNFIILGEGTDKEKIKALIHELGVSKSFLLLGYHTNPYKYIRQSDLYVCSSLSEGFSTSVTESLIVGTPVVTTLCSGMQELLGKNNDYGIVTENSENALYEGIKMLLDNPDLLAHYKKQAKIRGKEFSTEKTVKAVEDMLLSL